MKYSYWNESCMHFLIMFFTLFCRISSDRFQTILERLNCFISIRLFPPKPQDLPSMSKCSWWIPSATKVMALLSKLPLEPLTYPSDQVKGPDN